MIVEQKTYQGRQARGCDVILNHHDVIIKRLRFADPNAVMSCDECSQMRRCSSNRSDRSNFRTSEKGKEDQIRSDLFIESDVLKSLFAYAAFFFLFFPFCFSSCLVLTSYLSLSSVFSLSLSYVFHSYLFLLLEGFAAWQLPQQRDSNPKHRKATRGSSAT